jgi:hypothetical protein
VDPEVPPVRDDVRRQCLLPHGADEEHSSGVGDSCQLAPSCVPSRFNRISSFDLAIKYARVRADDINAQEGFKDAPEQYFVLQHYNAVIDSSFAYSPAEKIVMGFEPGPQAYTGVSGGIEHEKAIIAAIKDRVGGIMFWAANEAAVSSLNGKTTGENSGTLAAFAAGLVA